MSSQEPVKAKMNVAFATALTEPCLDLATHLRKERNNAKDSEEFCLLQLLFNIEGHEESRSSQRISLCDLPIAIGSATLVSVPR